MSDVKDVKIKIEGQVDDDYGSNEYDIVIAKLEVICAEYKLRLRENVD